MKLMPYNKLLNKFTSLGPYWRILALGPTSVPAWAGLDFARVRFWPQPPLERLFWSPFVLVVFGNVQPIRILLLRIYLRAWGGPRREDFLSLSKKITFHSKWLPCSSRVNFQDDNISLSEGRMTVWSLKIERRSSKEHSTSWAMEFRAFRAKKTSFEDKLPFC